jgi:hypothetical protein
LARLLEQRLDRTDHTAPPASSLAKSASVKPARKSAAPRTSLKVLKRLNDQVAADRASLAQHAGRIAALLHTLRINRHNLGRALCSPAVIAQSAPLAEYFYDALARRIRLQSRADLRYHKITLHRAQLVSEAFTATADYREVIETRILGYIMVVLTAVQAASVVPSIVSDFNGLHWLWRLAWVAGTTAALSFVAIWLLGRLSRRE